MTELLSSTELQSGLHYLERAVGERLYTVAVWEPVRRQPKFLRVGVVQVPHVNGIPVLNDNVLVTLFIDRDETICFLFQEALLWTKQRRTNCPRLI